MSDLAEQLVTQPKELEACCNYLAQCRYFGFDTEFVGEDTYHPHLCLVQVATAERLYLIDPLAVGPLDAFWQLVVDPTNLVVVHAGREEVRLCSLWTGKTPGNFFDLQIAAGLVGLTYPLGHAALVSQLLGVRLAKGETLTEWRDRPLTKAQIRYALDDVRYLLPLHKEIAARLEQLGRAEWAREEFTRLASQVAPETAAAESNGERWRKLRGLGALDRRRLAVVRALFYWREEEARKKNRPPRTIVRDDLLVEIAKRNPARPRDLHVVRGLRRGEADAIFQVIERARTLPPDQCPQAAEREQDPLQVGLVSNVLQAVLVDLCIREKLAANLAASTTDVRLLVKSRWQKVTPPADLLLAQGWRGQFLLPRLLDFLDGKCNLRVADMTAETPFAFSKAD